MRCVLLSVLLTATLSISVARGNAVFITDPLIAIEGEDLEIVCTSNAGGASDFNLRELMPGSQTPVGVETQPRIIREEADSNENQTFFTLNDTMRSDNGRVFVCAIAELTAQVTVQIYYADTFQFVSADALLVDGELFVEESSSATVEYTVEANPNVTIPTITRQDGEPVRTGSVAVTSYSVEFLQVVRDDAGMYTLSFDHEAGVITEELNLVVQYAEFTIESSNARCEMSEDMTSALCYVDLDTDITIDCQFSSFPDGELTGVIIPDGSAATVDGSAIMINTVRMEDLGMYVCTANNTVSETTISIMVLEDAVSVTTEANSAGATNPNNFYALSSVTLFVFHIYHTFL